MSTEPIIIIGAAPRSGTNYIEDLLCVHPDCGLGVPLRENHILAELPALAEIVDRLAAHWDANTRWGFLPEHADDLARSLGVGIGDFLVSQVDERRRLTEPPATISAVAETFKESPRYLVSKTPRATGLADFRRFFPDTKLILLMRDGRAVAESSIRSWGWHFDVAVDSWRSGAAAIADFLDRNPDDDSIVVRYEDMVVDPETQLDRIFGYLDLDPAGYDFEKGLNRPIRGSSTRRKSAERVTWEPVEATADFDPLGRASGWSTEQHARFNHMTGDLLVRFGYVPVPTESSITDVAQHYLRDGLLTARQASRPIRKRIADLR